MLFIFAFQRNLSTDRDCKLAFTPTSNENIMKSNLCIIIPPYNSSALSDCSLLADYSPGWRDAP